jgi:hypothetical protein
MVSVNFTEGTRVAYYSGSITMKKFVAAGLLPFGALLAFAGTAQAAPAQSDSSQTGNAAATISQLRAQGFDVRITRLGNAPLEECSVNNVSQVSAPRQIIPFDRDDINVFTVFPQPKVTVSLNCSR